MKIILYLHLHQPYRLARFRYVDLGSGRSYFDDARNRSIFEGIAARAYRPTLRILAEALESRPDFRVSLSVTGTFLEQAEAWAPDLGPLLKRLVASGRCALVSETYYHSLAFLIPGAELEEEVALHRELLRQRFGVEPAVLRMTELAYSDEIARFAEANSFRGMLAEGWEGLLKGAEPTHVYVAASAPTVRLLLRHYRLSDDVGFRFSSREWSEHPLTAEKYAGWLAATPGEVLGLFMDFETFGEHHGSATGILEFLRALPDAVRAHPSLGWATVEEAIETVPPRDAISAPRTVSWADQNRDLGAWLGNDLQQSAFDAAKKLGTIVRRCGDPDVLRDWRRLLTSDHFYYMYVGGHGADLGVHQYFSSYGSPFDAYANYMNALTDLRRRALARFSPTASPRGL